jgi:hypothetical protein
VDTCSSYCQVSLLNNRILQDRFPDLESIKFEDSAKVWPGELQKLKDRLPRLKHLDAQSVVESTRKGRDA